MTVSKPQVTYEPLPTGLQDAILVAHYDLGLQPGFEGKPTRKVAVMWELAQTRLEGTHFHICEEYSATLHEDSNLRGMLEEWKGEPLSAAEDEGFPLESLHGLPCTLDIVKRARESTGRTYHKVVHVYRRRKNAPTWTPELSETYLPEWIVRKITNQLDLGQGMVPFPKSDEFDEGMPF